MERCSELRRVNCTQSIPPPGRQLGRNLWQSHKLGTPQNIRFAQDGNLTQQTEYEHDIYRINIASGAATWMGEAVATPTIR